MSASGSYSPMVSKLYKSRNILLDILAKRGFEVDDYRGFSVNEVHIMYFNKQLDMLCVNPKTGRQIYVKYYLSNDRKFVKIRPGHIYGLIDDLYDIEEVLKPDDELVVISKDKVNDTLKNLMQELYSNDKKFVNIYDLNDYLFNILEHELVPPHRILGKEEKERVIKTYNVAHPDQLPEIGRFDPVAQAIGIRPGQVCEIIRRSPTAIETVYYRLCY